MPGPISHIQRAFRRDAERAAAAAARERPYLLVLAESCPAHDAAAGQPCWTLPGGVRSCQGGRAGAPVRSPAGSRGTACVLDAPELTVDLLEDYDFAVEDAQRFGVPVQAIPWPADREPTTDLEREQRANERRFEEQFEQGPLIDRGKDDLGYGIER